METVYSDYRILKENRIFKTEDGRTYPASVKISLLDREGREITTKIFGLADNQYIYKMISEGRDLILDNLYIKDFSLEEYRRIMNIDKKTIIPIKSLSAKNAFFESSLCNDFSHASFSEGEVNFDGAHFAEGRVSFTGTSFGKCIVVMSNTFFKNGNIEFNGTKFNGGDFLFKNAIINDGVKDFQDMHFGSGELNFANTEFHSGEILFINSHFYCNRFIFKFSRIIEGKLDFHYSVFNDSDINFERAEFGNTRVDFRAVDFGTGKVNFNRSIFGNGEINFEGATGKCSKLLFKRTVMGDGLKNFSLIEMENTECSFDKTFFGNGDVTFNHSIFGTLSLKSCHLNQYFDLRLTKSDLLDLSDTIVRDIVDLEPYDFPVRIELMNFTGMRLIGKIYIDWIQNRCCDMIMKQGDTSLRQKSEQFRILKENFNGTGKYSDEDKAYVMFKRFEELSWLSNQKSKGRLISLMSRVTYGLKWFIFDAMGLYATSPVRVLLSMIAGYVFFSLIYIIIIITTGSDIVSSTSYRLGIVARSFYHSAITFFTIGYGDHFPVGGARIVSSVEGFTGVFLMAYFTVAFVRKVLR
ncbi:MAG: two pore domain potassium channel family protein [Bacteroidales bacterium]|nr:two pore domain potassium channel family protein [Bacteroidales bacterium]